jgi:PAS domain S-box-containing protein
MGLGISTSARRKGFAGLLIVAFAAVLAVDVTLPVGYAVAILYALPVFAASLAGRLRWVVTAAGAALVATLAAAPLKPRLTGPMPESAVALNRTAIALMVVAGGVIGGLLIVRSRRLSAVSGELSSTTSELERQAHLLRAASQVGKVAGWSLDREEGSSILFSGDVERMFGIPQGKRTLRNDVLALVDDDLDREQVLAAAETCLRDGTPFMATFRATTGDANHPWVTIMGEARRDGNGRIVGLVGALQDVTLWKEAEATAAAQQQRFAQFANSLPAIIWTAEPSGAIDYFNDALVEYTGRPRQELLVDQWVSALHPDDVENTLGEWQRAITTGESYSTAFRLRRADGVYRWFRVAAQPERGDDGSIVKWWGNASDVHDYHLLEAEANRLAQQREDILETIGDAVYTLDAELRFTYLNSQAERLLVMPASALLGLRVWDKHPEAKGTTGEAAFLAALATGQRQRFTFFSKSLDAWFEGTANPTPLGLTASFRDITELRSVSEQLAQAQRMESVGRLTGGIAHDFNNLLTVVVGGTEALGEEPGLSDESREMVALVARAAARGAELTHQLLAFSRLQPLDPQSVDVSARIREMKPMLSRTIGHGAEDVLHLEDGLPPALVDPGQLENAILNLAINAGDAMPSGGTLTITTEFVHLDDAYSTVHSEVSPGDYVVVSVADTGTGIAPEHLPQVFEPFFTTKSAGEGSGLGLSMVWGFARQSNGHVTVYSEKGIGSTFRLYLPVATEGSKPAATSARKSRTPSRGSGHILLAEDDPLVRQFAAERLIAHGFEVTVASTGAEALELLDGIENLTLLFTDVIMVGGVSGRELADEVVARRPGTPVLYASGYTEDVMVHQGRLDRDVALLPKPYTVRQLIDRIHAVLGDDGIGVES